MTSFFSPCAVSIFETERNSGEKVMESYAYSLTTSVIGYKKID